MLRKNRRPRGNNWAPYTRNGCCLGFRRSARVWAENNPDVLTVKQLEKALEKEDMGAIRRHLDCFKGKNGSDLAVLALLQGALMAGYATLCVYLINECNALKDPTARLGVKTWLDAIEHHPKQENVHIALAKAMPLCGGHMPNSNGSGRA